MRAKRVGRPGKIDRDTMKMTNTGLIIIVIILLNHILLDFEHL